MWKSPALGLILAFLVCVANAACGGKDAPPTPGTGTSPSPGPSSNVADVTTGRERLMWDQQAENSGTLAAFRYAAYVDGTRTELTDISCDANPGSAGFGCSSRLPAMSTGAHAIELVAFVDNAGSVVESPRSSPLQLNVRTQTVAALSVTTQTAAGATGLLTAGSMLTTTDRVAVHVELVTERLQEPTDLGFAPDGRVFVTERAGLVRVVLNDQLQDEPALRLDDIAMANGGGLVAIAVDPQFATTRFVYVIYTTHSRGDDLMFRLARFRDVRGTLGERAVLLEGIPAGEGASANLRVSKDGKLYAAFDDGGDATLRDRLSSFNGKILRLNPDASTPRDNASGTPVYALGFQSPRGLDWQPSTGMLWAADRVQSGAAGLRAIASGDSRSIRGTVVRTYAVPSANDSTAMVFYHGALLPSFEGNLLIGNERGHYILRAQLDGNVPPNIVTTERLLQDRVGAVRALGIGRRGEIYFTTDNALGRLVSP